MIAASRLRSRMSPRSISEEHRVASPLELLFDLTFVVAVAQIASELAHDIEEGQSLEGIAPYLMVFFSIWWAWMNFTWFASAYDTDDVGYRLLTMLQMGGVLILAAGVPSAANEANFTIMTVGYLVMRLGLIGQWVRAGIEDPDGRRTAFRYGIGIGLLQIGWFARLALPEDSGVISFAVLAALELAVPIWAERTGSTAWHPHHITERYGLFAIILFGESVLAAMNGVQQSLDAGGVSVDLVLISAGGLILLFGLWWLYFLRPSGDELARNRSRSHLWGYGHFGIFASLAAIGAGLEVCVVWIEDPHELEVVGAGYALAVPAAIFLIAFWVVNRRVLNVRVVASPLMLVAVILLVAVPQLGGITGLATVVMAIAFVIAGLVTAQISASRPPRQVDVHPGSGPEST